MSIPLITVMSRGRLRAVMAVLVALLGSVLVGAAPASASSSRAAPIDPLYEWNIAKRANPPAGLICPTLRVGGENRVFACFERDGDKIWVLDTGRGDGRSATGAWKNYVNGRLYRHGACVNKLGTGNWGVCDKNMRESSTIYMYACNYETSDNTWHGCSAGQPYKVGA